MGGKYYASFRLLKLAGNGRSENAETKMGGKMPKLKQYCMDVENGRELLCIVFVSSIGREKAKIKTI